jgi:hypothetical protein
LIGDKGIQNLIIKNLALEMGFPDPALHLHFKGKTEILQSVLVYYKKTWQRIKMNISIILPIIQQLSW